MIEPAKRASFLFFALVLGAAAITARASSPVHPRSSVDPCAAPRDEKRARTAVDPAHLDVARKTALAAELRGVLEAPWIGEITASGEDRLRSCLVDVLLDGGRLEEAVGALERLQAGASLCTFAGYRLQRGSQPTLAARAFTLGLAREPDDFRAFEGLADVDPSAALDALARREPDWHARFSRGQAAKFSAELLVRCGRTDEAVARLMRLAEAEQLGRDEWPYLLEIGGERAYELLARIAAKSVDPRIQTLHAVAIAATDEEGSLDFLADRIAHGESVSEIVDVLAEKDPDRARAALIERSRVRPDAAGWDALGDLEFEKGRATEARAAWLRSIELDPEECGRDSELWIADADAFLEALRRGAARGESDEVWGRYGKWARRSGRTGEAIDAWRRASELDPEDSEWTMLLLEVGAR